MPKYNLGAHVSEQERSAEVARLKDEGGFSFQEIANAMGLTRERIRQLYKRFHREKELRLAGDWRLGWSGRCLRIFREEGLKSLTEVKAWIESGQHIGRRGFSDISLKETVERTGAVPPPVVKTDKRSPGKRWKFNPWTGEPIK